MAVLVHRRLQREGSIVALRTVLMSDELAGWVTMAHIDVVVEGDLRTTAATGCGGGLAHRVPGDG